MEKKSLLSPDMALASGMSSVTISASDAVSSDKQREVSEQTRRDRAGYQHHRRGQGENQRYNYRGKSRPHYRQNSQNHAPKTDKPADQDSRSHAAKTSFSEGAKQDDSHGASRPYSSRGNTRNKNSSRRHTEDKLRQEHETPSSNNKPSDIEKKSAGNSNVHDYKTRDESGESRHFSGGYRGRGRGRPYSGRGHGGNYTQRPTARRTHHNNSPRESYHSSKHSHKPHQSNPAKNISAPPSDPVSS